jgi:hypothetical protein
MDTRVPKVDDKQSVRTKLGSQLPSPLLNNHEEPIACYFHMLTARGLPSNTGV